MEKLPTVDIKGKEYVMVKDRILAFNESYPKGSIKTEILSAIDSQNIVIKASVFPGDDRIFTGHSQATIGDGYINKSAALENAETSAVGRALAMMGIGVIESVASADEIVKASFGPKAPYKSKLSVEDDSRPFENLEYTSEEDKARGDESTKRTISSLVQMLAKREKKEINTAQDIVNWVGENLGLDLTEHNYAAILNGLNKLHAKSKKSR